MLYNSIFSFHALQESPPPGGALSRIKIPFRQILAERRDFRHDNRLCPNDHSLFPYCGRDAPDGQAPDRRVGAQRAGADHDDLRPGRRAHAGLWHSAALRRTPYPRSALCYHDSIGAHHAQRPLPGGALRPSQRYRQRRQGGSAGDAPQPFHCGRTP